MDAAQVFATEGTADEVPVTEIARPSAVVIYGPWPLAAANTRSPAALRPSLEEQFAAFADEAAEWADASLPLATEVFEGE
jgi:hypothetical protein